MSKQNLGDTIIRNAAELFRKQGYKATSIKQIANASDCTTAALYYYFEGGKAEILETVMQRMAPDQLLPEEKRALPDTLAEFFEIRTNLMKSNMPQLAERVRWLLMELANLSEEDKAPFQRQLLGIQAEMQKSLGAYVEDETLARQVSWVMFCSMFGYQQLVVMMGLQDESGLDPDNYVEAVRNVIFKDLLHLEKRVDHE